MWSMSRFATLVAVFCSVQSAFAAATNTLPIQPFEAHYKVYGAGLPIGESTITLAESEAGKYSMRSNIRPTGLASLVISDRLSEQANGEYRDGEFWPLSYLQRRKDGDESHTVKLTFEWEEGTLLAQDNNERVTLALSPGVIDPLSLHIVVMHDLQEGRTPREYTLADKTELKTYDVKVEGEENLDTPMGTIRAVRINRQKAGSSRVTSFWFAPELDFLLVQISQNKEGSEILRMSIKDVNGIERQR